MTNEQVVAWMKSFEKEPDKKCITSDFKKILHLKELQKSIVEELKTLSCKNN